MKDESVIPQGYYCHDYNDTKKVCPYWRKLDDRMPQENGWCDYLEKGDIEIKIEQLLSPSLIVYNKETGQLVNAENLLLSLLWDQCKECNVNLGKDDD